MSRERQEEAYILPHGISGEYRIDPYTEPRRISLGVPPRRKPSPGEDLVNRYLKASGDAYASGNDSLAAQYRLAAQDLKAVWETLPPLPEESARG